jgi:hypothetical protein
MAKMAMPRGTVFQPCAAALIERRLSLDIFEPEVSKP